MNNNCDHRITPAIRCGAPALRSGASSALSNALIWGLIFAHCFGTFRAQTWKTRSKRRIAGFVSCNYAFPSVSHTKSQNYYVDKFPKRHYIVITQEKGYDSENNFNR
jgi:hypothetical protein